MSVFSSFDFGFLDQVSTMKNKSMSERNPNAIDSLFRAACLKRQVLATISDGSTIWLPKITQDSAPAIHSLLGLGRRRELVGLTSFFACIG